MTYHLRQISTGRRYAYTAPLANRTDMQVVDGPLPGNEPTTSDASNNKSNSKDSTNASKIANLTKDQLEDYAQQQYGVDLDKRKSHSDLVEQVKALEGIE